jgi:hypothetical protein
VRRSRHNIRVIVPSTSVTPVIDTEYKANPILTLKPKAAPKESPPPPGMPKHKSRIQSRTFREKDEESSAYLSALAQADPLPYKIDPLLKKALPFKAAAAAAATQKKSHEYESEERNKPVHSHNPDLAPRTTNEGVNNIGPSDKSSQCYSNQPRTKSKNPATSKSRKVQRSLNTKPKAPTGSSTVRTKGTSQGAARHIAAPAADCRVNETNTSANNPFRRCSAPYGVSFRAAMRRNWSAPSSVASSPSNSLRVRPQTGLGSPRPLPRPPLQLRTSNRSSEDIYRKHVLLHNEIFDDNGRKRTVADHVAHQRVGTSRRRNASELLQPSSLSMAERVAMLLRNKGR